MTNKQMCMRSMFLLASTMIIFSCSNPASDGKQAGPQLAVEEVNVLLPEKEAFADTFDGKPVALYFIRNDQGLTAAVTNYGARVVSLIVPDKQGKPTDVVIGLASAKAYKESSQAYLGAAIGRVANRIAGGRFELDGQEYSLFVNNGPNTLHGGKKGYQDVVWDVEQPNDSTLIFTYLSPDGEEGFPGNLRISMTYSMTANNSLKFEYEATTDKRTPVNLTNHAFFNLNGEGSGTINDHLLQVYADEFTPVDSTLIPLGDYKPVEGTPFDFRTETVIGDRVENEDEQLVLGGGYDHNYVLNTGHDYGLAAKATGDQSGIVMEVYTDQPGIQFYGGNFLQGLNTLKTGAKDDYRTAFCLETQHYPDAVNQPDFPPIILAPGDAYKTQTEYVFSVK